MRALKIWGQITSLTLGIEHLNSDWKMVKFGKYLLKLLRQKGLVASVNGCQCYTGLLGKRVGLNIANAMFEAKKRLKNEKLSANVSDQSHDEVYATSRIIQFQLLLYQGDSLLSVL